MRELSLDDFLRLLEAHHPVEIREEDIAKASEETPEQQELVKISENYPTVETTLTGGYILPTEILPWRFRKRLFQEGVGTGDLHGDLTLMIEEMVHNSIEHGNKRNTDKVVYLLWHTCGYGKQVIVADEGEVEFDFETRARMRARFTKEEISGITYLKNLSRGFEYFTIVQDGEKKGTLLRIVLEERTPTETGPIQQCSYSWHQLTDRVAGL